MKKVTACLVAALAISLSSALADKPLSFVVEGDTLHIFAPDGKEVGTGLPPATIARTVDVPPYSFQVSFGNDANGNLSVIVTPNPERPGPLEFTISNRSIQMAADSVVTVTLGQNGTASVTPGLTGGVKVDNHALLAAAGNPAAPAAAPSAPAPVALAGTPGASNPSPNNNNNPANPHDAEDMLEGLPPGGGAPQAAFNSNPVAVAVNNPQTNPSPTTPF